MHQPASVDFDSSRGADGAFAGDAFAGVGDGQGAVAGGRGAAGAVDGVTITSGGADGSIGAVDGVGGVTIVIGALDSCSPCHFLCPGGPPHG
jgi:hypothetical protein